MVKVIDIPQNAYFFSNSQDVKAILKKIASLNFEDISEYNDYVSIFIDLDNDSDQPISKVWGLESIIPYFDTYAYVLFDKKNNHGQ